MSCTLILKLVSHMAFFVGIITGHSMLKILIYVG